MTDIDIYLFFYLNYLITLPITQQQQNAMRFATTIVAPAGVLNPKLANIPQKKHKTERIAAKIITLKKLLKILIELRAGKTIKLEIIMAPISRMPITIVSAVKTAISPL